jgi:glycosyltransferase involved in cell wall biosynthesis
MSSVLIDLRGLNYPFLTGVNTVTLHIINEIINNSNTQKNHTFEIFGIESDRKNQIISQFPKLKSFFNKDLSPNLNRSGLKLLQIKLLSQFYLDYPKEFKKDLDFIYQTQPKPFPKPKSSKIISTFHDLSAVKNFNQPSFKHFIQENKYTYQKIINQAHKIITCSYSTAYDLQKIFNVPDNKIKVIYQALPDWNQFGVKANPTYKDQSTPNYSENKPYFLALSAFEYRKNFHNLILAWHFLKKNSPNLFQNHKLIIAGNLIDQKYFKYLQNLILSLELENIELITDINQETKSKLLENSLAVIYTSLYEGFGFPILEAQKYNKAVLTSNVSSMPEIGGKGVLLVNPLDPMQISDGIEILIRDNSFRQNLEVFGQDNLTRFSWNEYNQAINDLF